MDQASAGTADNETVTRLKCYFVRRRNALAVRADFTGLFTDYYLHQSDIGVRLPESVDSLLKDGLAAVALHAASRPWNEVHAWTVNFQSPLANVFVTADNTIAGVTGRAFVEGVRAGGRNLFFSQAIIPGGEPRTSSVAFDGSDIFGAVEHYYRQSEQRPAKLFRFAGDDLVLVAAQPQCDLDWLNALTDDAIRSLDRDEELSLLEEREVRWKCGCTQERIYRVLSAKGMNINELFAGEDRVVVTCPRCGVRYRIERGPFELWIAANP